MAVLIAIGLAVLGLAGVVLAIVALRDDAPRWTLKIKRPGWLLTLGLASIVFALLVSAGRYDIDEEVSEYVGQTVECKKVGVLQVEGRRRDVHACENEVGTHLGCFVRVENTLLDVSRRAEEEGTGEEVKPDC